MGRDNIHSCSLTMCQGEGQDSVWVPSEIKCHREWGCVGGDMASPSEDPWAPRGECEVEGGWPRGL